MAAIV